MHGEYVFDSKISVKYLKEKDLCCGSQKKGNFYFLHVFTFISIATFIDLHVFLFTQSLFKVFTFEYFSVKFSIVAI